MSIQTSYEIQSFNYFFFLNLDITGRTIKSFIAITISCKFKLWNTTDFFFYYISLYCRTPDVGYNWETMEGDPFAYFTYGAACTEVEIDCLTGDHTVSSIVQ